MVVETEPEKIRYLRCMYENFREEPQLLADGMKAKEEAKLDELCKNFGKKRKIKIECGKLAS